ncbi:hypothetical protein ACWKWU_18540 [Chitinophaga lutea]
MNRLNHLIYEDMAPEALMPGDKGLAARLEEIRAEKLRITGELKELALESGSWAYNAQAVRRYQIHVVLLMDALYQYHAHGDAAVQAFYVEASSVLEEVLMGLEQHFTEYLAHDIFVPAQYAERVMGELERRYRDTERYLTFRRVDARLLELVIRPLRETTYLTFGMAMYYRRLLQEMKESVHPFITDLTEKVHYTLYQYNFNSTEYFLYCTAQLRRKSRRLRSLQERKAYLAWYEKELQGMSAHGVSLYTGKGGLREQMLTWLKEEKYFMQTMFATSNS